MPKITVNSTVTPLSGGNPDIAANPDSVQRISGRYDGAVSPYGAVYREPETGTLVELRWLDGELHIYRRGESSLSMHLIEGRTLPVTMTFAEGEIGLYAECASVRHRTREGGGLLQVKYTLILGDERVSLHSLTIGYDE